MNDQPRRVSVLRAAVLLATLFDVFALAVLLHYTAIAFTLFNFVGELVLAVALLLLGGAVIADLRAKQLLPWGTAGPVPDGAQATAPHATLRQVK
jgi:hypothetical protein